MGSSSKKKKLPRCPLLLRTRERERESDYVKNAYRSGRIYFNSKYDEGGGHFPNTLYTLVHITR